MTRNDDKAFRATIAPGVKPPNFNMDVDINDFHCSFGHVHEGLLREMAKQRNVNLTGTLRECQGCSIAKGCTEPISTTTGTRAVKPGGRVFLDVCGEKSVQLIMSIYFLPSTFSSRNIQHSSDPASRQKSNSETHEAAPTPLGRTLGVLYPCPEFIPRWLP